MGDLLPLLRKALIRCRLDFDEVVEKARRGEVQFHEVPGACALTSITTSGPYRTCYISAVAGRRSAMADLDAVVTAFARANGCQCIEADARTGWSRIKPPAPGYERIAIKYRKELE